MSEFDFNDVAIPDRLLEINIKKSTNVSIDDTLKDIDIMLLEGLVEQLSYSDSFHADAWKCNVFIEAGWRKSL